MEIKLRNEISEEFKWNLSDVYKNGIEDFNKDVVSVGNSINDIILYVGMLNDKCQLKKYLDFDSDIKKTLYKLNSYSNRYFDQEQNNEEADILVQRVNDLFVIYSTNIKSIIDEIQNFEQDYINDILSDSNLKDYYFDIKCIMEQKTHTLSKQEEELMSKLSDTFSTSNDVYTVFKNTELKYDKAILSDGKEVEINYHNYRDIRESSNREDRKIAYDSFWKKYDEYKNTFSKLMFKFIKNNSTVNKIRNYNSSLEASLSDDNIPVDVYNGLIYNVSKNLDKFHEYLTFRKNILKYDTLNYYDLYNPIIEDVDFSFDYEKGKELVLKSTEILGEEYNKIMKSAFNDSWIDVYPNKFKDTGAYMCGSVYDVHPYILLNYSDKYDDVSTLAHELGHAAHSVFSNKTQTFNNAQYSTFIAEIASTTNEILLFDYMFKNTDDKQMKIFLLNNYIEHFRTTVFRQTMFAEFEKFMYDTVDSNDVLTSSVLNNKYLELLNKYHGGEEITKIDEIYSNEWSSVPHFYYNFYVYQYATSFISAVIIATKIINGDKVQLNNYIELLKSGGSEYPIDLLKKAGIDFTDEKCYEIAFNDFSVKINELKNLLSD